MSKLKRFRMRERLRVTRVFQNALKLCESGTLQSRDGKFNFYFGSNVATPSGDTVFSIAQRGRGPSKLYEVSPSSVRLERSGLISIRGRGIGIAMLNPDGGDFRLQTNSQERLQLAEVESTGTFYLEREVRNLEIGPRALSPESAQRSLERMLASSFPFKQMKIFPFDGTLGEGTVVKSAVDGGATEVLVQSPSWFFFVDLVPNAAFEHPAMFALIDANTGQWTLRRSNWFPVIDGYEMELLAGKLIQGGSGQQLSPRETPEQSAASLPGSESFFVERFARQHAAEECTNQCEGTKVLVIQMSKDSLGFLGTKRFVAEQFGDVPFTHEPVDVVPVDPRNAGELFQILREARKGNGCWCELVVYFTTHGNSSGLSVQAASRPDPNEEAAQGSGGEKESKKNGKKIEAPTTMVGWNDLLAQLVEICAKQTTIFLDSCGARGFADTIRSYRRNLAEDIQAIRDKKGRGENTSLDELNLRVRRGPYLCANFDLIAASAADQVSYLNTAEELENGNTFLPSIMARAFFETLGDESADLVGAADRMLSERYDNAADGSEYKTGAAHDRFDTVEGGDWGCCKECCCAHEHDEDSAQSGGGSESGCFFFEPGDEYVALEEADTCGLGSISVDEADENAVLFRGAFGELPSALFSFDEETLISLDSLYLPYLPEYPSACSVSCGEGGGLALQCQVNFGGGEIEQCSTRYAASA